jgi:hypothetical protein
MTIPEHVSAAEIVHISSPGNSANFYFSTETNSFTGQLYSAGCGARVPIAHPNGSRVYTISASCTQDGAKVFLAQSASWL